MNALDFFRECLNFIFQWNGGIIFLIIEFFAFVLAVINFIEQCKKEIPNVQTGIFGADMQISLTNDGPFTIVLDSEMLA